MMMWCDDADDYDDVGDDYDGHGDGDKDGARAGFQVSIRSPITSSNIVAMQLSGSKEHFATASKFF